LNIHAARAANASKEKTMNAAVPASVLTQFEPQPPGKVVPTAVWWTGGAMGLAIIGLLAALVLKTGNAPSAPAVAVTPPAPVAQTTTPAPAATVPAVAVAEPAATTKVPVAEKAAAAKPVVAAKPAAERTVAQPAAKPAPAAAQSPVPATQPATQPVGQTTPAPANPQAGAPAGAPGAPVGTVYSGFPPVAQPGGTAAVATAPAAEPARRAAVNPNLGTVESVTPVQVAGGSGSPINAGTVVGGVLGAVLGNQVGQGSGKTAATVLGAIGGAMAGNEVNRRTATTTAYSVQVRMDDGSYRTVQTPSQPGLGSRVLVDGGQLRQADGSPMAQPAPERRAEPVQTGG
jgi:outer membrane lipoprotein SlyB